jgi:hypothetical protein
VNLWKFLIELVLSQSTCLHVNILHQFWNKLIMHRPKYTDSMYIDMQHNTHCELKYKTNVKIFHIANPIAICQTCLHINHLWFWSSYHKQTLNVKFDSVK